MQLDAVVFGGGAAGLWLLDDLARRGLRVLLLEAHALGHGQTIGSQGILHGGLKYTLQGLLTPAAVHIREMPGVWREALAGQTPPQLVQTRVRADHCHLWRTESWRSRLGMIGAQWGLQVAPQTVETSDLPPILTHCPGSVARLDEQVISPASLLAELAARHESRLLKIDATSGWMPRVDPRSARVHIDLTSPSDGTRLSLDAGTIVLAAGVGNEDLRVKFGMPAGRMQRRPLHMVLVRGDLPPLNGHCVDGAKTRLTITSDVDLEGRTVWQVGGQLAEEGVAREPAALIAHARRELEAALPGLDLGRAEFTTYRVDRAEASTAQGTRPDTFQILEDGSIYTVWPTKLVLVPQLVRELSPKLHCSDSLAAPTASELETIAGWPRPSVASPPWDADGAWSRPIDPREHKAEGRVTSPT